MSKRPKTGGSKAHAKLDQTRANHNKRDIPQNVAVSRDIGTKVPPTPEKHDTPDEKREARDKIRLAVEIIGLIFVIIYAGLTALMYGANKKSADAASRAASVAEQTLRQDQRGWVAVTAINSQNPPEINKKFTYAVHLIDTGRTPARNVIVHVGDELLPKGKQPNLLIDSRQVRLGVLSPQSERSYEGNPIPEGRIPITITQENISALKNLRLVIHGKITYDDIFGCHHWVTYCSYLRDDWSGYAFCPENNDTGSPDKSCNDQEKQH